VLAVEIVESTLVYLSRSSDAVGSLGSNVALHQPLYHMSSKYVLRVPLCLNLQRKQLASMHHRKGSELALPMEHATAHRIALQTLA
jgi:hypothetical protein